MVLSATVRPSAPGIVDYKALNQIHEVLDGIKAQTDELQDMPRWPVVDNQCLG